MGQAYRCARRPVLTQVNSPVSMPSTHPLRTAHEAAGFGVKGFFLLLAQRRIKGFGGFATLFHRNAVLGVQRFHVVDTLGCAELEQGRPVWV